MRDLIKLQVWHLRCINMKIKIGDIVYMLVGKDKGRTGKINRIYKKQDRVLIEGVNLQKKAIPKSEKAPQGGLIDVERPVHISNIMVVDPKSKKPSRVGYGIVEGKKERIYKNSKRAKI